MKIFLSYRFTGEDKKILIEQISFVEKTFQQLGHSVYSTIHDSEQFAHEKWSGKAILGKAFQEIRNAELLVFLVKNEEISQGMIAELGYCLSTNKRIILLINEKVKESIFRRQIEETYEYNRFEELEKIISSIPFIRNPATNR